jgi:tripartite-type tricarboxylate transporter receptor subunit TctC
MKNGTLILAFAATMAMNRARAETTAVDPAQFFSGKTVDFLIGSAPGGGYSIYAGLLSRHIGKHLPGKPHVVGRHLPGGGSLVAANLLYNKLPKDGTVFGAIFVGAIMEPLLGDASQAQFDPRKMSYIGSAMRESSICVAWHTSGIDNFDDMFSKELVVGTSGILSQLQQHPTVLNRVLKTRIKIVSGYPGTREAALAMERGETGGVCGLPWSSFIPAHQAWLDQKKAKVVAQIYPPEGDPALNQMGIQRAWDYLKNEEDRKTFELLFKPLEFGRPYVLPPGVPPNIVAAYRSAFEATMKDADFLAEAGKMKIAIEPVSGPVMQGLVEELYAMPKPIVDRTRAALK